MEGFNQELLIKDIVNGKGKPFFLIFIIIKKLIFILNIGMSVKFF